MYGRQQMGQSILEKLFLDEIQEEAAVVTIILVYVLRLVELILLIEVVFWQVIFVLVKKPRYVCPAISLDIHINIGRIGIRVTLLILSVEAALDIRPITVVKRVISLLTTVHIKPAEGDNDNDDQGK